jgi:hypothetical protein
MTRVCAFVLALFLAYSAPVSSRDLTGIYVKIYSNQIEFLNLTDIGGQLTGYYQIVSLDSNSADGVRRMSFRVSGAETGSRLLLNLSGPESYSWVANLDGSGFVLDVPLSSGQIKQVSFRASSISEINRLVYSLTLYGNGTKYYSNVRAELADSQTRLSNDTNYYRPRILEDMRKAKAELANALKEQVKANQNLSDKEAIARQKHATADQARQAAQSSDEQVRAGELAADAGSADADVGSAEANIASATVDVQSANNDLTSSRNDLRQVDARIAQLRQLISRDKAILHIR